MKFVEEKNEKVFTNEKSNNIIKKNYNPLNKDCKIFEREGLCMEENIILEEIKKELNWKEKIIVKIFTRTFIKVYKIGITFGFNNKR